MRIIFICDLANPDAIRTNYWEPKILSYWRAQPVRFPARWSISNGLKTDRYATGIAEVTDKQSEDLAAMKGVVVIPEGKFSGTYSDLATETQASVDEVFDAAKIDKPTASEPIQETFDRLSVDAANKPATKLEQELSADIAVESKSSLYLPYLSPLVIPGVMGTNLTRRSLLKAAGLVGLASLVRPRLARATTVFSDDFTTTSDADMYPGGTNPYPNWDRVLGDYLYVNASNDRVQAGPGAISGNGTAYVTAGGIPDDYRITADMLSVVDPNHTTPGLLARVDPTPDGYCYKAEFALTEGLVTLYRDDNNSFTSLASQARTISYPASCSLEVTGTGATVSLTAIGGGTAPVTFDDTDAARLLSGPPGISMYVYEFNFGYIDNVVVDDLATPPATAFGVLRRRQ